MASIKKQHESQPTIDRGQIKVNLSNVSYTSIAISFLRNKQFLYFLCPFYFFPRSCSC